MATVTGLTAARMQEIIDATIVGAHIDGDDLVLELHDASEINVGDVRGPTGPQGNAEVGDVKTSVRAANHSGWLIFGATHTGADVAYPDLWALADIPSAWKVGSDLVLPSMADTIVQGDGAGTAIGDITGANTKTLVEANLPPHTHSIPAHTHPVADHTHTMAHVHGMSHTHEHPHTHTINHDHASQNFICAVSTQTSVRDSSTAGTTNSVMSASATGTSRVNTVNPDVEVNVNVNLNTFSGTSGAASDATTGASSLTNTGASSAANTGSDGPGVTGSSIAGTSGAGAGTSTPVNVEQKALRLNYFIYGGV